MCRIFVTTKEMYDNLFSCLRDIAWDEPSTCISSYLATIQSLAMGNMDGIRKAFWDGTTAMMLGRHMEELESLGDEKEISVEHNGKIIGVLVSCEISY